MNGTSGRTTMTTALFIFVHCFLTSIAAPGSGETEVITEPFCNIESVYPHEFENTDTFLIRFKTEFEGRKPVILKGGALNWSANKKWNIEDLTKRR